MTYMKKTLSLLLLLLGVSLSYSLDIHWSPEPVIIKSGLNNNTVYNICYGKDGFVWLSTDRGVARYDGFRFRNYPLIAKVDSSSLPLPQATSILQEVSGNLIYIQLYQGGIACFDREKERYLPIVFNRPFTLRDIQSFRWCSGVLYLATSQGLFKSQVARKDDKNDVLFCTIDTKPLVKGKTANLCADGKNNLYFSIDGKKVMHYNVETKDLVLLKEYGAANRLFLKDDYLWIDRLRNDIVCYNLKGNQERVIPIGNVDNVDYFNPYVTDVVCRSKQIFYLTTSDGLFELNFENGNLCESPFSLELLTQYEVAYHSNIERKMTSALWDNQQKILWTSTLGGGIVKFDMSDRMYSWVQQKFRTKINGIVEDVNGYIWLVMNCGTLVKSTTPSLSSQTRFEVWKKASGFSGYCRIYKDKKGYIWLGNNVGEVMRINPLTDEIKTFNLKTTAGRKLSVSIFQFCMDSRNHLWIATSGGLMQVDSESYECRKIEPKDGGIEIVYAVVEDKEGSIWIGTNRGLKRLEYLGDEIHWKGGYEKDNGLEESAVRTIYVNNSNQIYAAYLNMVIRIDGRDKDKLESIYTLQNGLISGNVSCMVDDQIGNTWAGNSAGIMTIRNGQDAFYNYLSIGDCSASCRLNDGRLLWADSWGLLFFDPAVFKANKVESRLMLTDIEVNGETVLAGERRNGQIILSTSPEKQEHLSLNQENNKFRLYFSDLQYGMMQCKIAYRLLPEDEEWRMQPLEEGVEYSRLPVGNYVLQVKQVFPSAKEGEVVEIPIVIRAAWYHTVWVYCGYGLLVIILLYIVYRHSVKKNLRRQIHREHEILLREKLNMEKVEQKQKQEIEAMRNRLLVVFIQELRTPLSLIIAPLKEILEDKSMAPNFATRGRVAYRNSLRMLDACNQLLAIHQHGNVNEKLKVAAYQVEKLLDNNLFDVRELLKMYSINFQYEKRIKKELEFYVDKKKVEFIIHSLLTNAFIHINYSGNISLTVSETVQEQLHYVTAVIEYEGQGMIRTAEELIDENEIPEEELVYTEMGFSAIRQIVEIHHGKISLESSHDGSTKVIVSFPLDKSVFEDDPNVLFVEPEDTGEIEPQLLDFSQPNRTVEEFIPSTSARLKKTLLIVEDHKDIRLYLKVMFGKEYNLLMATNGQEGIDMAVKELPDLILCDVMMPVKNGFDCCRELKGGLETCSIPIIMLTAKVEDEDIIHGLELGADDYVLKPFTPSILKAKVQNLINNRQALKQMYTKLLMLPGMNAVDVAQPEQMETVAVEDPFISSVIKIVEENICKADFSVKKLASDMNMSQPTLYRKVKQSTDYTIIELIRGVRMRRASVLLKTKEYGVQEVAEMVGYNDIPTFRKHFVDAFGITPSTYE